MIKNWKQFENYYDFDFGDCYIYAIAMYRLYGYPIYGVKLFFKEDDGYFDISVKRIKDELWSEL